MKKITITIIVFCISINVFSQELRKINNEAFKRGEVLKYRAYYDAWIANIGAGEAVFTIKNENRKIANRNTMHIEAIGKSKGAFNWFFKVDDRYETYIDEEAIAPWLFIRRVYEDGYVASQDVTFNQFKNKVYFKDNKLKRKSTLDVPEYTHDIVSAIFYARTLDFNNLKINDEFPIQFMFDDTVFTSKIVYLGKATLKIGLGKFNCLKFKPMVLTGNVFDDPYPMVLYVTDDKNHIPVLAVSKILVGSVKLELIDYKGLANPLTSKINHKKH